VLAGTTVAQRKRDWATLAFSPAAPSFYNRSNLMAAENSYSGLGTSAGNLPQDDASGECNGPDGLSAVPGTSERTVQSGGFPKWNNEMAFPIGQIWV
jgi:hypothetical protein